MLKINIEEKTYKKDGAKKLVETGLEKDGRIYNKWEVTATRDGKELTSETEVLSREDEVFQIIPEDFRELVYSHFVTDVLRDVYNTTRSHIVTKEMAKEELEKMEKTDKEREQRKKALREQLEE